MRNGCSTRHDTHHEPHTLSSHTWPLSSAADRVLSGACSCGNVKAGTAFSLSGDGISRGSRLNPFHRNRTTTVKTVSGRTKRHALMLVSPRGPWRVRRLLL